MADYSFVPDLPTGTTNVKQDNINSRQNELVLQNNFKGTSAPSSPVEGQTWYDSTNKSLWVYNGSVWRYSDYNSDVYIDHKLSAGNFSTLQQRLEVSMNDDGTLKTSEANIDEFKVNSYEPTYINPTTFTIPGDVTSVFTNGRAVKVIIDSATPTYEYGHIYSSSYSSPVTTIVLYDSILTTQLYRVYYGILQKGSMLTIDEPAQFSNDNKVVNSAFVQKAIGNSSGYTEYSNNTTLTVNDIGKIIALSSSATIASTFTLPSPALMSGISFTFINKNTSYQLEILSSSGSIYKDSTNWGVSSIFVSPYKKITLVSTGTDWVVTSDNTQNGSSSISGFPNNISSGRKVSSVSGLTVNLTSGVNLINDTSYSFNANSVTLPTISAGLVCDKSDGTTVYVPGEYPTAISSTVHRWIITGASSISSTVGTNNLTASGSITQNDGWIGYSGLGSGGYYVGANSTSIPTYSSAFSFRTVFTFISNSAAQCFYHDGVRKIACNSSNYLLIGGVSTNFVMTSGVTYNVEVKGAGSTTTGFVYLNGVLIFTGGVVANTTVTVPYVLANNSTSEKSVSSIEYVELFNASIPDDVTGAVSNMMIFPCFYTNSSSIRRSIIDDVVPVNSAAVLFAKTSSTTVSSYNDLWPMYGRREGVTDGNRKFFLQYVPVSGVFSQQFKNPFGTENVEVTMFFKKNLADSVHSQINGVYGASIANGPYVKKVSPENIEIKNSYSIILLGDQSYTGVNESSGYIGLLVEMAEDFVGVV